MVILRIAAAGHADEPPGPLVIDGVGIVKGRALGILRAAGQAKVTLLAELRPFGGQIDHPARYALAIKGGRGAADDVDALNKPWIDLQHVMAAAIAHQAHAVKEQVIDVAAVVAAQRDGIKARRAAAKTGINPGVYWSAGGIGALIGDLLAGDHRYRLGGSYQRLIGFRGAG